jgi:hypothetical protein
MFSAFFPRLNLWRCKPTNALPERAMTRIASNALTALVLSLATPAVAEDQIVSCTGPFARDASHAALLKTFGAKNVTFTELPFPAEETNGTVIFPNDKARRIEIIWKNERARRNPVMVTFGPAWRTAEGIAIESPLAAVEKMNGRPFTLSGFEHDGAGTVYSWKGGALAKRPGGCTLVVRFGIRDGIPGAALDKVSGDRGFSSRDPGMVAVKPGVRQIAISYE